ncbi:MAG: acyl carrier protein [Noviherbaspirillum sp.]
MRSFNDVRNLLADTLSLGERGLAMGPETPLLGSLPELDSMAVVQLIAALEEYYDFRVDDDEISADAFATLGSLVDFVDGKLMR